MQWLKQYLHQPPFVVYPGSFDMTDFLFLLGAGASVDAGLPTANEMTRRFTKSIEDANDSDLVSALSLVLGGIHFLRGLKGQFPSPDINVEELAITLDALASRNISNLSPFVGSWNELLGRYDGTHNSARDCISELRERLRDEIKAMLVTPDIGKVNYFQQFRPFLKEFDGIKNIDVFTLNYDRCVETALEDGDISYTTGVGEEGWDASLFEREDYKVRLYKLHGSLDWYRDTDTGNIFSTTRPPENRVPSSDYSPLLIFGITNKLQSVDPFLHLSYTFSQLVKKTKIIVTIGYGFGDDYINQMILQGFSIGSDKVMIVVSYSVENAQGVVANGFEQGSIFADAGRIKFYGDGCRQQLTDRTLLGGIKKALEAAADEGPFT